VGLFMPADRGKEPRSRARRTLGAEHKGGLLEPSPLSEDDGSRRDRSGRVNSSGDIFSIKIYKKLLTNSKLYDIIKNRDRHIPINSISDRYMY
jgi:hypothetical protein